MNLFEKPNPHTLRIRKPLGAESAPAESSPGESGKYNLEPRVRHPPKEGQGKTAMRSKTGKYFHPKLF
jgi:hypothetical protein